MDIENTNSQTLEFSVHESAPSVQLHVEAWSHTLPSWIECMS